MITVRQYVDRQGTSPFEQWMDSLDDVAAARVLTTVTRIGQGNFSSVKGVGGGVFESRIDFGPGYRVYFGKDGATVVIFGPRSARLVTSRTRTGVGRTTNNESESQPCP